MNVSFRRGDGEEHIVSWHSSSFRSGSISSLTTLSEHEPLGQRALDEPYEQQIALDSKGRPRRPLRLPYYSQQVSLRQIGGGVVGAVVTPGGVVGSIGAVGGSGDVESGSGADDGVTRSLVTTESVTLAIDRKRSAEIETAKAR